MAAVPWWLAGIIPREIVERTKIRRRKALELRVKTAVLAHGKTLARKREQTLRRDDYGNMIVADWLKEVDYFLDRVVAPTLGGDLIATFNESRGELGARFIEPILNQVVLESKSSANVDPDSLSPTEYEAHCAKVLRLAGWRAQTTKATGDQGADVIAEKDGTRVVLQCKKYSQPVGNKAVQEVFAAMRFEHAQHAAVVSNADYTRAARQLAATNGVLLLHHEDLPELSQLVSR